MVHVEATQVQGVGVHSLHLKALPKKCLEAKLDSTNNQMELSAAIEGLAALKEPCNVDLFTDSKYVMDGITQWIHNWKKNSWRTAAKKT